MLALVMRMVILSWVTATISLTLTRTYIFKKPRDWLRRRSEWWDKLASCPYCTSHWVALFLSLVFDTRILASRVPGVAGEVIDSLLGVFFIVALAAVEIGLIAFAFNAVPPAAPPGNHHA